MKKMMKLIWISFLLFGGVFSPVKATTLSEVRSQVRILIKDNNTVRQRYTDTQLTGFINQAQHDVINNTWALQSVVSFDTTVGTTYYAFPYTIPITNFIGVTRLTASNKRTPETTLIQMDSLNPSTAWETQTGKIQYYYTDDGNANRIAIYPIPLDAASTTTIKMWYYCTATDLSLDTDGVYSNTYRLFTYADILVYYVAYRVYLLEGEVEKATAYQNEYLSRLKIMQDKVGQRVNYNPNMIGTSGGR